MKVFYCQHVEANVIIEWYCTKKDCKKQDCEYKPELQGGCMGGEDSYAGG